ncbi:MAG: hypothetical protein AAF125_23585, partial [Chloroflexota bacterium]
MNKSSRWNLIPLLLALVPVGVLVRHIVYYSGTTHAYADDFLVNLRIVTDVRFDNFDLLFLIAPYNGHIQFPTHLLAYVFARLGVWNPTLDAWINFSLGLVCVALVIGVARYFHPERWMWYTPIIAGLMLTPDLGPVWFNGAWNLWFFMHFGMMMTVYALLFVQPRWLAVVVACLGAIFSMLSMATGLAAWLVLGLALIVLGWRQWWAYVIAVGTGTAAFLLFLLV